MSNVKKSNDIAYATENYRKNKEEKNETVYASSEYRNAKGLTLSQTQSLNDKILKDLSEYLPFFSANGTQNNASKNLSGQTARLKKLSSYVTDSDKLKYNGGFSSEEERKTLRSAIKAVNSHYAQIKALYTMTSDSPTMPEKDKKNRFIGPSTVKAQLEEKKETAERAEKSKSAKAAIESGEVSLDGYLKTTKLQQMTQNAKKAKDFQPLISENLSRYRENELNKYKEKVSELKTRYYSSVSDGKAEENGAGSRDEQYLYINNLDNIRNICSSPQNKCGDPYTLYLNMSKREIGIYNSLYSEEGKNAANEFLKFIKSDLEEREYRKAVKNAYEFGEEHPVIGSVASVGTNIVSAGEQAKNMLVQAVTGEAKKNKAAGMTQAYRSAVTDKVDWEIAGFDAFDFIYGTAMSGIDSLAMSALGGAVGGTLGSVVGEAGLGLSAAANASNDVMERGGTSKQAFWSGITAGVFESLFEHVSISNLKSLKSVKPESIKNVVKNLGKSMLTNASEETFTEIANVVYDYAANDGISHFEMLVNEYTENENLSEAQAKRKAAAQTGLQILEAGAGGALMGLGFGSYGSISGYVSGKTLTNSEKTVVGHEFNRHLTEMGISEESLGKNEKRELYSKIRTELENGEISTEAIEKSLGGEMYTQFRETVENEKKLKIEYDALNGMRQSEMTEEQSERKKELESSLYTEDGKLKGEVMAEEFYTELYRRMDGTRLLECYLQKYEAEKPFKAQQDEIKSERHKAVIEKAEKSNVLSNTKKNHSFVNMVAQLAADKGMDFDFTNNEQLKKAGIVSEGRSVGGYVTNGNSITVNIDSEKSLESVVGHEITHTLENSSYYEELKSAAFEYAEMLGEYEKRLNEITDIYSDVEGASIENELTAELVGDYLFGDQRFINRLSSDNGNLFVRIFNEIKYFCRTVIAGSREARQLEKLRYCFEKAYGSDKTGQKSTAPVGAASYSLSQTDGTAEDFTAFESERVKNGEESFENNANYAYEADGEFGEILRDFEQYDAELSGQSENAGQLKEILSNESLKNKISSADGRLSAIAENSRRTHLTGAEQAYVKKLCRALDIDLKLESTSEIVGKIGKNSNGRIPDGYSDTDGTLHMGYTTLNPTELVMKQALYGFAESEFGYGFFENAVENSEEYTAWLSGKTGLQSNNNSSLEEAYAWGIGFEADSGAEGIRKKAVSDFAAECLFAESDGDLRSLMSGLNSENRAAAVHYISDFLTLLSDKLTEFNGLDSEIVGLKDSLTRLNSDIGKINSTATDKVGQVRKYCFVLSDDEAKIAAADKLKKSGADKDEIWQKCGLIEDSRGNWVREISDFNMELTLEEIPVAKKLAEYRKLKAKTERSERQEKRLKSLEKTFTYGIFFCGQLEDAVKHDELFTKYPQLKDIELRFERPEILGGYGSYGRRYKVISISMSLLENYLNRPKDVHDADYWIPLLQLKKTMVHEIQHAIQDIEDRESGSDISMWISRAEDGDIPYNYEKGRYYTPEEAYWYTAGEIEARGAANRSFYKNEDLIETPDISYDKVVYRGENYKREQ